MVIFEICIYLYVFLDIYEEVECIGNMECYIKGRFRERW